jgi:pyrroloquinoline quinone biosynthesis protein B
VIKPLTTGLLLLSLFSAANAPQPVATVKVILLGIAQDGGIPHIGCENEICRTHRHYVSSLAIVQNQSMYLIDATPDLREQHRDLVKKYPSLAAKNLFNGIFLTHAHMGHYAGLLYLGKESVSTKQIPVYSSQEMNSYLRKNAPWSLLVENANIEIKTFQSNQEIDLGFKITPLPVPHRKEFTDTFGYLIQGGRKSLLYIPDIDSWEPIMDSLQVWLNKADYALLDGTFYSGKELPGRDMTKVPHPTIEHSLEFFKKMPDIRAQIFFTHLNHTNPVLNAGSEEAKSVTNAGYNVAVDWQEFTL